MKKTPFIECEDVGNMFELQSFNSKLQAAVDIYVAGGGKRKKLLKKASNQIKEYLEDVFGPYIGKEISVDTHTGKIEGILTGIIDDGGIVGPFLRVKKQKKGENLPSTEIIGVQLLQYGYKLKIREAKISDSTLEVQDSVQEKVAELVH